MHNKPNSEKEPQSVPIDRQESELPPSTKSEQEPRTGWLHNTSPRSNKQEVSSTTTTLSAAQLLLRQAKMQQERNHRIISPPAFHTCANNQVAAVTEHKISVPLQRGSTSIEKQQDDVVKKRLDLYFAVVEIISDKDRSWWNSLVGMNPTERATAYVAKAGLTTADDLMLYLQGGPGFGAPTPVAGLSLSQSWASEALTQYDRIVLMDQRGTGRSTPITKQRLQQDFENLFLLDEHDTPDMPTLDAFAHSFPEEYAKVQSALQETTDFMAQFRADNIVRDAEDIKNALMLTPSDDDIPRPYGCALGQSYGGFCLMTYLSQISYPPRICLLTGGIAPMLTPPYNVYEATWNRVKDRSFKYYEMYPGDIPVVKKIVQTLLEKPITLPSGSILTARRFLQIGMSLGGSPSSFANIHRLLSNAFLNPDDDSVFTRAFLKAMDSEQPFDDHPIYYLLHESIYADGGGNSQSPPPTNWAAHRAFEAKIQTPSEWDYRLTSALKSDARPTLFFGEMVFPWMSHGDFAEVSGVGMRLLAQSLAEKTDWGPLYDKERMRTVLEDGTLSRAAAAVYYDDLYVDFDASMRVTKRGGPLEKCKVWVTNDYQHSGLRDDGATIFAKLHGMATGSVRTPS